MVRSGTDRRSCVGGEGGSFLRPMYTILNPLARDGKPLRLERLTLREMLLPLKEPFRISSGTQTSRRILLLELEDAEGIYGLVRVRGAGGAELQRRDDRHRLDRPRAVGGAAGARPLLRQSGGGLPRPAAQLPGTPDGEGGGGDGHVGAGGRAAGRLARPPDRRHPEPSGGRDLARHPGVARRAGRAGPARAGGGLPQGEDQDQARRRRRVRARGARRAGPQGPAHGRRQQRLHAGRHAEPLLRAGRARI